MYALLLKLYILKRLLILQYFAVCSQTKQLRLHHTEDDKYKIERHTYYSLTESEIYG